MDINTDGSLLIVATLSTVKIFRVRFRLDSSAKVNKIDVPATMCSRGAKIVKFSGDNNWLATIRPDNTLELHRFTEVQGSSYEASRKNVTLKMMKRLPQRDDTLEGTHGSYDRSISQVAFSADSRVLAVSDIRGYIDTWVLEGYEDLEQDPMMPNGVSTEGLSDDNESGEDEDEERHPILIFGQHWIRNPAGSLIPRLEAVPLIFSFRPSEVQPQTAVNGHAAVHPTRHTPRPHSHALPNGESRLFILTSKHHMHEFDVLTGRLSDWSRRNPTTKLPTKFRNTRERVAGLIWDINRSRERIWLYGNSWLWMFDLSVDLPDPSSSSTEPLQQAHPEFQQKHSKRKRSPLQQERQHFASQSKHGDSGAGGQIPEQKLTSGMGRKLRKVDGTETRWFNLCQEKSQASEDDEDSCSDGSALVRFRREYDHGLQAVHNVDGNGNTHVAGGASLVPLNYVSSVQNWSTYKYRPILGIIPLSSDSHVHGLEQGAVNNRNHEGNRALEVALIERPMDEVDLPPRFYGDQDWDE